VLTPTIPGALRWNTILCVCPQGLKHSQVLIYILSISINILCMSRRIHWIVIFFWSLLCRGSPVILGDGCGEYSALVPTNRIQVSNIGVSEILDQLVGSTWRLKQLWVRLTSEANRSPCFPGNIMGFALFWTSFIVNFMLGGELLSRSTYWFVKTSCKSSWLFGYMQCITDPDRCSTSLSQSSWRSPSPAW
jgi:hypothetical protein